MQLQSIDKLYLSHVMSAIMLCLSHAMPMLQPRQTHLLILRQSSALKIGLQTDLKGTNFGHFCFNKKCIFNGIIECTIQYWQVHYLK